VATADGEKKPNPLRAVLDIRRGEIPLAALMFSIFFLIISTFWILKPIKKAIFIEYYEVPGLDLWGWHLRAAQAELIAKVANMFVAAGAVVVFTWLSRRLVREKLVLAFAGFFIVTLGVYSYFIQFPSDALAWSFYLYGDLWTTLMVATFFAFLNDSVTPSAAKRLYGLIVLGGVAGGAFGATFLRAWVTAVSDSSWMLVCLGATAVIALLAFVAGRLVAKGAVEGAATEAAPEAAPEAAEAKEAEEAEGPGNPALEGAKLVFRSRYLLAIVGIVALYEIVSTILDYQFTATIVHYLSGEAIGTQFATVYAITNVTGLVVQLLLTTFLMNRFRLTVSLLVTPLVILSASVGYLAVPILWLGSLLNTADNAFNYSINQSAREALYTPTTRDEKYKAKAFIDMFVQRFAKALAVGLSLGITTWFTDFSTVRWLSLLTVAMVGIWMYAAWYGGRHFRELTGGE
jgi:AAA family ATP:ADP antiporter